MKLRLIVFLSLGLCSLLAFGQDSLNVTKLGQMLEWQHARRVATQGNYAFIAVDATGLVILDVANPSTAGHAGFCNTPGDAYDVAVSGSYAYLADGESGLRVIDISNPALPGEVGSCDTPGAARGVAVSGNYVYVADYDHGLRVIDVSNPAAPSEVGFCDTPCLRG
jgi:hypothetical protein